MSKNLFEPLDIIIAQAKGYLGDVSRRQETIKNIELMAIELQPQAQAKITEITNLYSDISQTDDQSSIKDELAKSLSLSLKISDNILLFSEKSWASDFLIKELDRINSASIERIKKFCAKETTELEIEISASRNMSELSEVANRVAIDYDLFEQSGYEAEVITMLIRRVNELDLKHTVSLQNKDYRGAINHLMQNNFKSQKWPTEMAAEYTGDRDIAIFEKEAANLKKDLKILFLGLPEDLLKIINHKYYFTTQKLDWADIWQDESELIAKCLTYDLVALCSYFPNQPIFKKIATELKDNVRVIAIPSTNPKTIIAELKAAS